MQSKRVKKDINGILLIDKPKWHSSNKALQIVKRFFSAKKAGHTGNLDPMATGVLPICFGKSTKLANFLLDSDKEYLAKIKLGQDTTTLDVEGDIILEKSIPHLNENIIKNTLKKFEGKIKQTPPMFSALKKNGVPLYKLALKGEEIERKSREINIYKIELKNYDDEKKEISILVLCSKGTYIRVLGQDIAHSLGTCGHLNFLERTKSSIFNIEECFKISDLERYKEQEINLEEFLISNEKTLSHLKKYS